MLKKVLAMAVCICAVASTCLFANTPVINAREKNQARRIRQGVKSGKLTQAQATQLKQEVKDVNREKQDMRKENGGKPLTAEQRKLLRQDLNKSSKDIYQAKHPNTQPPAQQPAQQ